MTDPFLFALAVALILATPGPTNIVMATAGATRGTSAWQMVAAGLVGYLLIVELSRLVLLPLVAAVPAAGIAIKVVVVLYLVYVAIKLWRDGMRFEADQRPVHPALVFFTTLLNPKGLVFAVSIFPRDHPQIVAYFALFAGLVVAFGFAWFSAGRGLAALAGKRVTLLPRLGAVALVLFAALLAASVGR